MRKMKGLFLGLFLMLGGVLYAARPMGTSLGILGGPTTEKLAEVRDAGIGYVEVTFTHSPIKPRMPSVTRRLSRCETGSIKPD